MLSAKSKKGKDFLIGNVVNISISFRGIRRIQRQLLVGKRGLQLKEATSAVHDVHEICKSHPLLSLLVTDEVKHTQKALQ